MGDFGANDLPLGNGWEAVAGGPVLRLVFDVEVELTGLEGFEGDTAIAVELHLDAIEVVFAAVDRQLLTPPVLDPLKHQAASRADGADLVWPAAQRHVKTGGLEIAVLPVVLR